jgi:hypothetical protein
MESDAMSTTRPQVKSRNTGSRLQHRSETFANAAQATSAFHRNFDTLDDDALERLEKEENLKAKRDLFKILVDLDTTTNEEISIRKLINLPYRVDDEDADLLLTTANLVKIIKM